MRGPGEGRRAPLWRGKSLRNRCASAVAGGMRVPVHPRPGCSSAAARWHMCAVSLQQPRSRRRSGGAAEAPATVVVVVWVLARMRKQTNGFRGIGSNACSVISGS